MACNRSEKNMLAAINNTSKTLHDDIAGLMLQMSNLTVNESTYEALFTNFQTSHAHTISQLSRKIETILLEQRAIKSGADAKLSERAHKRVCASLYFRDMDSRRDQIREANEDTYKWILGGKAAADKGLGDFHKWLDSPCPPRRLFWISGKPGSGKSTLLQYLDLNLNPSCCSQWLSGQSLFVCKFFLWNPGRGLQKLFQGMLRAILYQCLLVHP